MEAIALNINELEDTTEKNIRASEIMSSELSSFIKLRFLKTKIKNGM